MWKFVVIEWVDGSWKATQTKLLEQNLQVLWYKVDTISFPMYSSWSCVFVEKFLNWEFWPIDSVDPYIASVFYTLDRFWHKKEIEEKIKNNDFLISDRYSISNFIHRWSHFLQQWKIDEMKKFFDWIYDLEFKKAGLPSPDLIIFLSLSLENIKKLLLKKAKQQRDYIKWDTLDWAEKNLLHQKYSLEVWKKYLKQWFDNLVIIECEDERGQLLSPEKINKKILEVINV